MKAAPHILIVEDEPLIRLDLAEMLTDDGYQAGDGETAVYLARQLASRYHDHGYQAADL
ncbi:hypothetical protein AB0F17_62705 [Nonomuraea sp. NPDC026600]|uniref:hypothetical protein n=1 Tax=Nonomuraea sp. NPDC026600 TaxID=3155363 RepID=UPI003411EB09